MAGGRIVVSDTGAAFFQALGCEKESYQQNVMADPEGIDSVIEKLGGKWFYCPGIPEQTYNNVTSNIRYSPSSYLIQRIPQPTVYSKKCISWYKRQRQRVAKMAGVQICKACRGLMNDSIRTNKKNVLDQTKKSERINQSSINMKFLSPSSQKMRLKNIAPKNMEKERKKSRSWKMW